MPNLTVKLNAKNRRLIHIVDSRLSKLSKYSMDTIVSQLRFDGTTRELIEELARQGTRIGVQTTIGIGDPLDSKGDWTTHLKFTADNEPVRELLSNFLPLDHYERVLWVATTELKEGAVTLVKYKGERVDTRGVR